MRRAKSGDDNWLLALFQDPLVTMSFLVLFFTLPIILPGDDEASPLTSSLTAAAEERATELDIARLAQMINDMQGEADRLRDEIRQIKKAISSRSATPQVGNAVALLHAEVTVLESALRAKRLELEELDRRVREAAARAAEVRLLRDLEGKIATLRKAIEEKQALLGQLRARLTDAQKEAERAEAARNQQQSTAAALYNKLRDEEAKNTELEARKATALKEVSGRSGLGAVEPVGERKPVGFEAYENKIIAISDDNYDTKTFLRVQAGRTVVAGQLTRKPEAAGEERVEIRQPRSGYESRLQELKPNEHYLFFVVRDDAFDAFIEARQIAWEKGFIVGWGPWGNAPITVGPGAGRGAGRSPQ